MEKVKPFQGIGYTRLFGFGATVAAVPYATTEMFKVLYDVTDEEQAAIRRYVARLVQEFNDPSNQGSGNRRV